MIITCEECSTRFTLDDSLIKPTGSKVRCSHCKHIFTAFPVVPKALEPDTLEPNFDTDGDIEFEEPDLDFSVPDDSPGDNFDTPGIDQEPDVSDFDDQDIDFDGIDFDEIEFDEEPDFSGPDFPESNRSDAASPELEMDSDFEMLAPSPEPEPDVQDTSLEFEDSDLEFGDDDLELESQDLEFEDLQLIEDENGGPERLTRENEGESTNNENQLGLSDISLAMDDPDEDETGLEEIEFETEEDVDLELVFDDDPDADLVFEEAAENIGELSPLEMGDAFDAPSALKEIDEFEPDLELEEEPDFLLEAELSGTQEDPGRQKFTDYDAVLDQDPEPAEVSPGLDDNDMEPEPDLEIPEVQPAEMAQEIPDQSEHMLIDTPSAADTRKKRAKKSKGNVGAPIKIFFLLFLLVIAAYVASLKLGADIPYLSKINIPYITDALKPAPQPQPPLKPVPNEANINGRFISNTTAGELFIVTGRIENPSTIAYSHIKVKGTLLTKDKTKAGTQLAYCGNIISEETLKAGNISDITKQLAVKQGLQNTNVNIKPGGSVLFMLVFSSLPENLTNFTVEVVSFQAQAKKK